MLKSQKFSFFVVIRRNIRRRRKNTVSAKRQLKTSASRRRSYSLLGRMFRSVKTPEMHFEIDNRVVRDIWAIGYITLAILTYFSHGNKIGAFGEWWSSSFQGLFGIGINFIPALFLVIGIVMLTSTSIRFNLTKIFGIIMLVASSLGIVHLAAPEAEMFSHAAEYGGFIGFVSSVFFRAAFALFGAKIILIAVFLVSILLTFGVSFRELVRVIWRFFSSNDAKEIQQDLKIHDSCRAPEIGQIVQSKTRQGEKKIGKKSSRQGGPNSSFRINNPSSVKLTHEFKPQKSRISDEDWNPPSLDLLAEAEKSVTYDERSLRSKAEVIRQKLARFGIDVMMQDVNIGPAVMQYTLKPAEGVKLSKIINLKHDLALALAAKSLRIEAPIPGKSLVGIEIPTEKRIIVRLKELLLSKEFSSIKSNLGIVLGRDVSGSPRVADLAAMPHLLVAGATGSGKSVGINTFLLSLIFQNSPNDLRLILVDPKRVELVPYNGIPHLLTPVINDPEKTISALKWAVSEMTRRYKLLAKTKVRNIYEYNMTRPSEKMPYIVIVIDELADLMMTSAKEVEGAIMRLAQMARAVGIHLILATQRPSVNVITGVIKANIPTRLSFAVTSGVDSKTILDTVGAEDLLGMGDMLFIPPGESKPVRIQGTFISTDEVRKVTNAIKLGLTDEPEYNEEIIDSQKTASIQLPGVKPESTAGAPGSEGSDEYILRQAARVIIETGRASASLLQRRLSLGYARAARIIDMMESRGFVGHAAGAKPRDIFITAEKLAELESGNADPEAAKKEEIQRQLDAMDHARGDY